MRTKILTVLLSFILLITSLFLNVNAINTEKSVTSKNKTNVDKNIIVSNDNTDSLSFKATITEIRESEIAITVSESGDSGFPIGEPLILITEALDTHLYSSLTVGDNILVEFNGIVMNSFPGKIGTIYNITLIEDF